MKPKHLTKLAGIAMLAFFLGGTAFAQDDNEDTPVAGDTFPKVRLGYFGHNNAQRQLLIGFHGAPCTDGVDPGYDAVNVFDLPNDAYFWCNQTELFIQGVGEFNPDNVYPLGVKSDDNGVIVLQLINTENFDPLQPVYIYDNETGISHDLKGGSFNIYVGPGTFNDRFSLRFTQTALNTPTIEPTDAVSVNYFSADHSLNIKNTFAGLSISDVSLIAMDGRLAGNWKGTASGNETSIPMSGFSSGVYIVNVSTSNGNITKKIVIR